MDNDGYPDEDELSAIRAWPCYDFLALLQFVRELWKYSDCGYWAQDGNKFRISTAGWSGNEDLIGAMRENFAFWSMCWQSFRRGGHYEFEVPNVQIERLASSEPNEEKKP